LTIATDQFEETIEGRDFVVVVPEKNKSDTWVISLIKEFKPDLIKNIKSFGELSDEDSECVFFDDRSFSGLHMLGYVALLNELMPQSNIYVVTAITTSVAQINLSMIDNPPTILYGDVINDNLSSFLSEDQLELIKNFYELEEGDVELGVQFAVFFDHKMPGVFSSVPFIYAGLIPETGEDYPLIKGCEKGSYLTCPPVPYR
jgi:hypothetical protein